MHASCQELFLWHTQEFLSAHPPVTDRFSFLQSDIILISVRDEEKLHIQPVGLFIHYPSHFREISGFDTGFLPQFPDSTRKRRLPLQGAPAGGSFPHTAMPCTAVTLHQEIGAVDMTDKNITDQMKYAPGDPVGRSPYESHPLYPFAIGIIRVPQFHRSPSCDRRVHIRSIPIIAICDTLIKSRSAFIQTLRSVDAARVRC